jgi:type VI secretion system protein ImpC
MPGELSFGGFSFGTGQAAAGRPLEPDAPFHICVIGDFGGRRAEPDASLRSRRIVEIDRDNFDDVLQRLDVEFHCEMPAGQPPASVRIQALDDFHPDQVISAVEVFESLSRVRRQLLNPSTFDRAAAEMRGWLPAEVSPTPAEPAAAGKPRAAGDDAALLAGILDEAAPATSPASRGEIDWNTLIRDIVQPYAIPAAHPDQAVLVDCVDSLTTRTLLALLQHPRFRSLESTWRGLWFLVRRLETDTRLKVFLLDVSRDELAQDLAGDAELRSTAMHKRIVEYTRGTPGVQPFAVLLGLYSFGADAADAPLLDRLVNLAQAAGAPFIAAAAGALTGCPRPDDTPDPEDWLAPAVLEGWADLRTSPTADWGCLIWPSFVLRLPYGPRSSPIETFDFAEIQSTPRRDDYLWGNPALIAGCLLGQAYAESGWKLRIGELSEVGGLPLHVYQEEGESVAHPVTELLLSETGARRVIASGVTPLWAVRDQDVVQLPDLKSLRGGKLAGRWSGSV